ncbi:YcxB family protein [Halieaceae bacterium IMCC14734]|uniref:YcxB family protein n=1 Tax=Candidatus Litorirhabdus singularis TaxID=2518993 RepID=A0ABT3TLD3_9GAMM|nr:YcxB family protein [Candidatus Litorirhabdus singularis]MCX2983137.1 YcxB family protein [Candidatus Litorirhabdus singularis]
MQPFDTQFTLSRHYLAECFDESLPYGKNPNPNYLFPASFLATGAGLLFFTEQPKVFGGMLIALAVLELIHIRFRRAWWLRRQMWGRSADSEVTLNIDEDGVRTQSAYAQTALLWSDIERVIETDLGLILTTQSGGQQYLSKSLFSTELIIEIVAKSGD